MADIKQKMEDGLLDMYFEYSPQQAGMSLDELVAAINSLEIKRTRRELQSIMRFYDEDNTGVLDFEEFRSLMIELLSKNSQKELDFEKMKEEFV